MDKINQAIKSITEENEKLRRENSEKTDLYLNALSEQLEILLKAKNILENPVWKY
jgi:hypothetical protein